MYSYGSKSMKPRRRRLGKGYKKRLNDRQKKQVKRLIAVRQELKYYFATQAATAVSTTPVLTGVPFDIPQGDADLTRDGDRLMWCGKLEINLQIVSGQTSTTSDLFNNVRFMVFQWHPMSTGAPTPIATSILLPGPSGNPDIYSVYNHDFRQCYKVLYDKVFKTTINSNSTITDNSNSTTGVRRLRIPLGKKVKKQVQYQGGGGQATNRLFLLYMSDSSLATHPTLAYMTKVFFRDS